MDLGNIQTRIGFDDLNLGISSDIKEIIEIFSYFSHTDLVGVLTVINCFLSSGKDETENTLRYYFINPVLQEKINEFERKSDEKKVTIFSRQSILILIDFSLKYGSRTKKNSLNMHLIGNAVLIMNSHLAKIEDYVSEKKKEKELNSGNRSEFIYIDHYADQALKQFIFTYGSQLRYSLPRGFLIYKGLRNFVKPHLKYINIDDLLLKYRKIDFLELYSILIVTYSHFINFKDEYFWKGNPIIKSLIFKEMESAKNLSYQGFLESLSVCAEEYDPQIPDELDYEAWYSYSYQFYRFRLNPLIKISSKGESLFFCSDLHFVINAFWDAPYNIVLVDHDKDKKLKEDFFGYLGDTFEDYIQKLTAYAFKGKFRQIILRDDVPLNDGVIKLSDDWIVVLETKAARPSKEFSTGLEPMESGRDFEKLIRKGFIQLTNRIKEYRETGHRERITPILITSGYIPQNSLIWSRFRKKLSDLEIFNETISDYPILLDVEAWEVLCAINNKDNNFENLINDRLSSKTLKEMSPHDFLFTKFGNDEPSFDELISLNKDLWLYSLNKIFDRQTHSEENWKKVFKDVNL